MALTIRSYRGYWTRAVPANACPSLSLGIAISEAVEVARVILFNLCGHGHFDMQAYIDYHAGKLVNYEYPEEEISAALAGLPTV